MRWQSFALGLLGGVLVLVGVQSPVAAASILLETQQVRSAVVALTREYSQEYSDRVSPAERNELASMAAQARGELNGLVSAVRRAERTDRRTDWNRAAATHQRARAQADVNFERAKQILAPRLSLREQLSAYADFSAAMRSFDALGDRISKGSNR